MFSGGRFAEIHLVVDIRGDVFSFSSAEWTILFVCENALLRVFSCSEVKPSKIGVPAGSSGASLPALPFAVLVRRKINPRLVWRRGLLRYLPAARSRLLAASVTVLPAARRRSFAAIAVAGRAVD